MSVETGCPEGDALAFFPPAFRTPVFIRQLPEVDNPAADAELVALKPDVYVDYGTVHDDYIASVEAVQRRTGVPGIILDGEAISRIPATYRRLGASFGVPCRAVDWEQRLELHRSAIVSEMRPNVCWRSIAVCCRLGRLCAFISPARRTAFNRVSADQECWRAAGVAGRSQRRRNAGGGAAPAPDHRRDQGVVPARHRRQRRSRCRRAAARESCLAVHRRSPRRRRVYEWPGLPYSWGARPPSVNRLPGVGWLAYVAAGRQFDEALTSEIRGFYRDFYHLELTDTQLQRLAPDNSPQP